MAGLTWQARIAAVPSQVHSPFSSRVRGLYIQSEHLVTMTPYSLPPPSRMTEAKVAMALDQGSDPGRFPLGSGDGGYVVCEGWMHPDGGIDRAITVARAAGKRIVVVADVWEPSERYFFTTTIEPLLGADAVFVGEVDGHRRIDLLCRAEAVISPTCWEPAVVSMIEALACGTPVVAAAAGAAAEFVDDGRTGYLCDDDTQMADGLVRARDLNRRRCRSSVVPVLSAHDVATGAGRAQVQRPVPAGAGT